MISIHQNLNAQFNAFLLERHISVSLHNYYRKWLRYYLDYCHKYNFALLNPGSLTHFLNKPKEKKQTNLQQNKAREAIGLFYKLVEQHAGLKKFLSQPALQNPSAGTGYNSSGSKIVPSSEGNFQKPVRVPPYKTPPFLNSCLKSLIELHYMVLLRAMV